MARNLALICWIAFSSPALFSQSETPLVNEPPKGVAIPEIIQSFAAKEAEFKQAREHYAYTQDVTVKANCKSRQPGVYHLIVDVTLDGKGKRREKVTAVDSTIQCILITKEDIDGFGNQSLPVLTTEDIQNYHINFVGQQQQDDLRFYVFDVSPVSMQGRKPQFDGRIWVDSRDFYIVKSHGTKRKNEKGEENPLPAVTTWRERIDGRYWFPAYSRANDVLHFSNDDVQIEELVKFSNYKAIAHP